MTKKAIPLSYVLGDLLSCTNDPPYRYERKADKGDATAQFYLGGMYANGDGVPQDYAEAMRWYQSAGQGNATAQFYLGYMYANGQGVPAYSAAII